MLKNEDIHHPNDVTCKFIYSIMPEKLKNYLKLPGKFVRNFPTHIIKRDGVERDMDWLILVKLDNDELFDEMLINIEFQSSPVTKDKIMALADYSDYSKIYYGRPVLSVVVITQGYEKSVKEYHKTASDILKPVFINMSDDEVIERLKNLEEKISNQEQLSDDDALDIVFLPMFSSMNNAQSITEKVTILFSMDVSLEGTFRYDIAFALSIMIRKYFDLTPKGKELLSLIEPELSKSKLRDVIDFEVDYVRKSYEHDMSELNEVIDEMSHSLEDKDAVIANRDAAIADKDAVIANRDAAIADKDAVIANRDAAIADKDAAIANRDAAIAEKDEEIRILKEKLAKNGIT